MRGAAEVTEVLEASQPETPPVRKLDRLALLYEGILTVAERVHTGRQQLQDPEEFRLRMKKTLEQVAATATKRGYSRRSVEEATFAVVSFLDEAILTAPDSGAINWVGKSLGEELFDQRSAGELFFKRLDALRTHRDSQDLAEILEVYQLCLLLGYEGKYAGGAKGELQQLMANLRERIERIFGREQELSPDVEPDTPAVTVVPVDTLGRQLRWLALAMLLSFLVCYIGFSVNLHNKLSEIHKLVMDRVDSGAAGASQP